MGVICGANSIIAYWEDCSFIKVGVIDVECWIPDGIWPVMITPFTESGEIDYGAVEQLVEWYISKGVSGIFAVCQSSEMFYLSLNERTQLAAFIVKATGGRVPVVASGHVSVSLNEQIEELKAMADTGVEAVVLVNNRLAEPDESDSVWQLRAERILDELPNMAMGLYECPYPYKRPASTSVLKWCASTGRFVFFKDTSCNVQDMNSRVQVVRDTKLKVFNANSATLLESLKCGVAGYTGVMANFHPELYVWLFRNWRNRPKQVENLQQFLGLSSLIELQMYPVSAKYYLQLDGLDITLKSRMFHKSDLTSAERLLVEQLYALSKRYFENYSKISKS